MKRHANEFKVKETKPRNRWHLELQQKFPGKISKNEKRIAKKYACRNKRVDES